jgi:hypothetical protein
MAQDLGIQLAAGIADELDGNHFGRARDAFAVGELEQQTFR